jgi:hypothetical protein
MLNRRGMWVLVVTFLIVSFSVLFCFDARAQWITPALSADDVLEMFARLPACEGCADDTRGHYERSPDAREIATAIVATVDGSLLGSSWREAALMSVFAAFESNVHRCAVGDGGLSWGTFQLRGASRADACTPERAARIWYWRAQRITVLCAGNPLEERLAALASGSCDRARAKVRHRFEVASHL